MNLPTGTRGRLVAVAILLILVILVAEYLVMPAIASYRQSRDDIYTMQDDLNRYQRILDRLPTLQASVEQLNRTGPLRPYLLSGNNRALAAAGLQTRLQAAADKHGAKIVSLRVRDTLDDGPFERVPVDVHLQAGLSEIVELLQGLQNSHPILFAESLSIQARARRRGRAGGGELDVRITLYGLRAADGAGTGG